HIEYGSAVVPIGCLLVGVRHAEYELLLKRAGGNLHSDGRSRAGKTTADIQGRQTRYIKWNGTEAVGAAALVLPPYLLAVYVQPACVAFLYGRRGKADRRDGEQLNPFKQRAKLIADDSPHPLSHDISRSGHQERSKIRVECLRAIVGRSGTQVMIVSRGVFYATR